ncbi:MAG TPA: carbohydrate porin [Gemmataceae bacterium]|jgi:high affinity Mn2+ porin|nr:carbohydrate porin [Gemmataceae bacterium]
MRRKLAIIAIVGIALVCCGTTSAQDDVLTLPPVRLARTGQPDKSAEPGEGKDRGKKSKGDAPDEGEAKPKGKDDEPDKKDDKAGDLWPEWLSAHAQGTVVSQGNWKFRSPYEGSKSLLPILNQRTTETATIYFDAKFWDGADAVFNPEVSGGRGLSGTTGMAGFPNGEATRVGHPEPTPYVARAFFRQTIGLGGGQEDVEEGPNQLAGKRDVNRFTFRAGKFAATDVFDDNSYSHDPRTQFLNWSLMANGAWDYPANTRGYTYGFALEFIQKDWAWRYGAFGEPTEANGSEIDPKFLKANGQAMEVELRFTADDRPGKLRLLAYLNNAHMGSYRDAILFSNGSTPDITSTRAYRMKYGFGLNFEQELNDDVGAFARAGWNDGATETWAFTEIDRTASIGFLCKGTSWARPDDRVGLAVVFNGLSGEHRNYLGGGGVGFIVGDGALKYGYEQIVETFYSVHVRQGIIVTLDFQGVNNPAYNRDRGPVAIAAIRAHFEY